MYRRLLGRMNMVNMVYKTNHKIKILFFSLLTFKAGGVQISTNVSTQVNVESWYKGDIMNYTIDVNKYNLNLSGITSLVFEVKACGNVCVFLSTSDVRKSSKPLYGIGIGHRNTHSYIFYREDDSKDFVDSPFTYSFTPYILNCTMFLPFWISWAGGDIKFGTELVIGENVVGNLTNMDNFEVKSIGVFTIEDTLGKWKIQVEDIFAGYFDSCSMDNTKSDMAVVDIIKCSEMRCATSCGPSKTCMGYNFNSAMNRCELLSFGSNTVTDLPHHIEAGWRFYSKCYNGKTACLGCYF